MDATFGFTVETTPRCYDANKAWTKHTWREHPGGKHEWDFVQ